MKKESKKVDFDLSTLKLDELIEVHEKIEKFLLFLDSKKIDIEQKGKVEK